jgi:dimethylamine--corrinoid protein Co-methyltransferase
LKWEWRRNSFWVEMGMASEFILGLHGELEYDGVRLAGLFPHDQVRMAQKAGATIFGPAINIVTNKSLPFNLARSLTYTKACSEVSEIPIHAVPRSLRYPSMPIWVWV